MSIELSNTVEELKQEVMTCERCNLCRTRNNVVFGEGNSKAEIMLIGEGPGYYEDQMGRPFVGRSGELLDKILGACGFNREEHVFIGNIVKCRPPNNRNPHPEEKASCIPYLHQQIKLIDPKIIVLLGGTALQGLIDEEMRITKYRGRWMEWNGRLVMPTYHPAALLRRPEMKRPTWEDFKMVVAKYRELVDPTHHSEHC
ncbi:MAG: uracil-DNA glycosylase family protein [Marinifilaceae bacterium]